MCRERVREQRDILHDALNAERQKVETLDEITALLGVNRIDSFASVESLLAITERAESEARRLLSIIENERCKRHTILDGDEYARGKAEGYRLALDEVRRQIAKGAVCDDDDAPPCPADESTILAWELDRFDSPQRALAWLIRRAQR